jgi:copper(I)-binding protein
MLPYRTIIVIILVMLTSFAHAEDGHDHHSPVHHGDLMLEDVRIKALLPGAKVSAGYLEIMNKGRESDRLIGVKFNAAGKSEIHTIEIDGDVMKMRPLADGIEIPAGSRISLAPGGYHLMFMKLDDFPKKGETAPLTLIFEKAGPITLDAPVMAVKSGHNH